MTIYYAFMCEKGWLDFIGMAATRMSYRACLASAEILWGFVIMMSHKRNEHFFIADALSLFLSPSRRRTVRLIKTFLSVLLGFRLDFRIR